MVIADLDGDGIDDVLTNEQLDNHLEIYWGDGSGNIATMANQTLSLGRSGGPGGVGDVDNDGDNDILWGLQDSNTLRYIENLGGRSFAAAVSISQSGGPRNIVLVDVDQDGNLDALIFQRFGSSIVLRLGNGDGTFDAATVVAPLVAFNAADLDGDGSIELVTNVSGVVTVQELDATGTPGPSSPVDTSPLISVNGWPFLVDADGDDDLDLYVRSWDGTSGSLGEFLNDGLGNFGPGCVIRTFTGTVNLPRAVGDLNEDGVADTVGFTTCSFCPSTITAAVAVRP